MSATTDLFPIGEAFAEMDLVVRQLDDGSLTVASDDSLPDDERLRVSAADSGLMAQLHVAPAPDLTEGLSKAIDFLNKGLSRPCFVWRSGYVWREGLLPWSDSELSPSRLQELYTQVCADAEAKKSGLTKIARGEAEWVTISERAGRSAAPPTLVPPSFLPGSGQHADERATLRYGAVGEVPGRSELSAAERVRPSQRASAKVRPSGSSAPLVIALSMVAFGGLVGALVFVNQEAAPAPPAPPPTLPDTAEGDPADRPPDEDEDDDGYDEPDFNTGIPLDVGGGPDPSPTPAPTPISEPPASDINLESESEIWDALTSADSALRKQAVVAWAALGLDEREGARLRILEALKGRMDRDSARIIHKSFREKPVQFEEALQCLDFANVGVRRVLIEQLAQPGHSPDDAEIIADMLGEYPESEDMMIELALIRLGHPKPDAAVRLVNKLGLEWVQYGDGPEVLATLAKAGLGHIKSLVAHPDPRMRIVVCKIIAKTKAPNALGLLKVLVSDDEPEVRRRAVEAITSLRDPRASWILARALLKEEDRRAKESIQLAFSKLPAKSTSKYLRALYKKGGRENNMAAVESLHAVGRSEAIPALVHALRNQDAEVLLAALGALAAMRKQPSMQDTVASALSEVRRLALNKKLDKSVRKSARRLYYAISSRFPE